MLSLQKSVEDILNSIPEPFRSLLSFLVTIVVPVFLLFKSMEKVEQDEVAVRSRFGAVVLDYSRFSRRRYSWRHRRLMRKRDRELIMQGKMPYFGEPKVLGPGLCAQVLFVHHIFKEKVTGRLIQLDDIQLIATDHYDGWVLRNAVVNIRMTSIYRWRFLHTDSMAAVKAKLNGLLGEILNELGYDNSDHIMEQIDVLCELLRELAHEHSREHGYVIDELIIGQRNLMSELSTGRAIANSKGLVVAVDRGTLEP